MYVLSRKQEITVAAIPRAHSAKIAELLGSLFRMPCRALDNYLAVTLTPSNPILHTTRLYSMFRDYKDGVRYPRNILFYAQWDMPSSEMLIACDAELQTLCRKLPMDLSEVISLKIHYESDTPEKMTKKSAVFPHSKGFFPLWFLKKTGLCRTLPLVIF